jgi:nucleoside-diphosphate-sugar epimerase
MYVALTGATGFVGSHTVKSLVEAGHRIRALVRSARNTSWLEELGVEICRGEMTDEEALYAFVEGADAVIHTAYDSTGGNQQLEYLRSNIFGSLTLLEFSRLAGVSQFICTTSTYLLRSDVYTPADVCQTPVTEDSPLVSPQNTYVMHNTVLESACRTYYAQFGMNTTAFRCAWIYGIHPTLEKTVWRDIFETVQRDKKYESTFGCDVVAVDDVARALTAAVDNPMAFGQVFNLCDMFVYNQELAQLAREVIGGKAEIVQYKLPKSTAIGSEQVKRLGVDVHRGMAGIRAYFEELHKLISHLSNTASD